MQDCHGFSMMRVIKNFHISNNKGQNIITFPKIDDIKWTNHRIIEQFVTRWKGLTRYLFDSGSTFSYVNAVS